MVDVTVRGAGIFGLSIAWACVERGAKVQIIDPFGPGAGSSGGVVGALAPHVPENWNSKKAFQLESLLMAEKFWQNVSDTGGQPAGYIRSGRVQPLADDRALSLARLREKSAATLWAGHATWRVERHSPEPWMPASPSGWVVHDTLSALIHPRRAVSALVAALAARGVQVSHDGPDRGCVVWATGVSGLEQLTKENTRMVGTGVKGQAALLKHDARGKPQLFVDGLHIIPHLDGTVAIGVALRHYATELSQKASLPLSRVAALLLVIIIAGALTSNWDLFIANLPKLAPALITLNLIMLVVGIASGRLMGLSHKEGTAIAIENSTQNAALGITVGSLIAQQAVGVPPFSLPSAVYGITMYALVAPFVFWRRRAD